MTAAHVPFDGIPGGVPRAYLDYLERCRQIRDAQAAALTDQMEALDRQMAEVMKAVFSDEERAVIQFRRAMRLPADQLPQE